MDFGHHKGERPPVGPSGAGGKKEWQKEAING